jgi:hypothetical protein
MFTVECDQDGCDWTYEAESETGLQGTRAKLGAHRWQAHKIRSTKPAPAPRKRGRPPGSRNRPRTPRVPDPTPELAPEPPPEIVAELAPQKPRGFLRSWFTRERVGSPAGEVRPPRRPGRPPGRRGRTSLGPAISTGWMMAGEGMLRMGDVPVGRVLQLQSAIAGDVLDGALSGTMLDRVVQPLMGEADRYADVGKVLSLPLLVWAHERHPTHATGMLIEALVREQVKDLAAAIKRQRLEDAKLADAVETLTGEGVPEGMNPVHGILNFIFGPPQPGPSAPAPADGSVVPGAPAPEAGEAPPSPPPAAAPAAPPFTVSVNGGEPVQTPPGGVISVEGLPFVPPVAAGDVPPGLT